MRFDLDRVELAAGVEQRHRNKYGQYVTYQLSHGGLYQDRSAIGVLNDDLGIQVTWALSLGRLKREYGGTESNNLRSSTIEVGFNS